MNKLVLGGVVVALAATTACTKKVKLDSDIKKASYAIGQQIGGNLKQQNIDFDADALAQALKDASAGKNEMTKEDMQAAMMKLQEMAMKKQQEAAETNSKAGKDFLEKNKSAANVKTTASGLQYIIEKEGTGAQPKKEDVVKVHYKGTLTNGEQFDSSYERGQPAEFPVGGVIPGWTEALQLMKVGSKAKLFIPPELAYGPSGRPGIPPNSVLVFEVELMDIVKAEKPAAKAKK
ncbi:FKBP-type peptidyl-prolyl cis-trans isomerase [Bdellovibrio sp. SKB1291214]|uniref:FKBP-type peptidyl-prolyl cis-trans isomerase n=1 Tax=Bdellovibrio sp. SKB1291214 TaxID=1732569 RepID=UPI000B517AF7|nr:FKBP-type peptidyl-prolyl cis-trans isomerase [Bdellovibrio sp. SKB1291214]UYL09491.1 FKBP-type peptidyl-prolyl cis-trans isomerase [Bdellovibrio sp. SKB1291214]